MNRQQQKYAIERVTAIYKKKCRELLAKHTTKGLTISKEKRATVLRSGKVKLKKGVSRVDICSRISEVFDFSKYDTNDLVSKKCAPLREKLESDFDRVRDEIMLGDEKKALDLIAAFSK